MKPASVERRCPGIACTVFLALSCAEPSVAASGEIADKIATGLAIFIIIALPITFIVLFWLVHVLPEKIAEKRQHPQKDAIHVLCLLSLVFGGLLWPLAWLWAYTKPVLHRMAYGRDKHDDYYEEPGRGDESRGPVVAVREESEGEARELMMLDVHEELARLRQQVDELERRGAPSEAVFDLRGRLAQLEDRPAPGNIGGGLR